MAIQKSIYIAEGTMFHKRLLKEFPDNRKYIIGMVIMQWIALLANIVLIYVMAKYIDSMLNKKMKGELQLIGMLVFVMLIRGVATFWNNRFSFIASTAVKKRLRERIFSKLMKLGTNYHSLFTISEIVQVSTEGVEQLEIYFGKYIPQFFYSLLAPLTLFGIVGTMSMKVAVVLLLCVPLIPVSIVCVQKFAKKMLNKYWGTYTELGDSFLENLQGLTTLKIYEADGRYAKKMDEEAEKFRKVTMRVLIMQLNSISVMDFIAYGGAAVGIILSILEYQNETISFAECFFIMLISAEFFLPLRLLGSFFHIAMNGNAAANKIFKLLDVPVKKKGSTTEVKESEICLNDVSFGYTKEKRVLNHVTMKLPTQSFCAVVGASGSGKSTIASLLMGDYDQYKGSITIGGVEVLNIEENTLHRKITRIRHDSYLFQGTVRENLCVGKKDATDEMLWNVLRQVDLEQSIEEKGGLDMVIMEKASNLSGGQKQRMALARAILHNSDIYIFDEATSNIDAESENKIMEVIHELAKTKTIVLISHRLANVVGADHIFVVQDGQIVEDGNQTDLMKEKGYYYELYQKQKNLEKYADNEVMG